ncbi:uncharacterized protein I303_106037 [Kwoniella dejecticola CBS 10117]|uniref:Uncharacterized protein n=1 Tax=Kwoniella dejecticola CBS 10117 TaxID=1296121 RepID=A0A1A6A143_9TREE|nr:uncharacterized protein I303_06057 [Kwoniella dejecticola CBS 10117]OBR83775.1 hypothetical protein I303_06057 [Kwoniella dejecticola CBS 10117]
MQRRKIAVVDLVHSHNSSPVPFTRPSIPLPLSQFTSPISLTGGRQTSSGPYAENQDRFKGNDITSPDPLNCLSPTSPHPEEAVHLDPDPDPLNCLSPIPPGLQRPDLYPDPDSDPDPHIEWDKDPPSILSHLPPVPAAIAVEPPPKRKKGRPRKKDKDIVVEKGGTPSEDPLNPAEPSRSAARRSTTRRVRTRHTTSAARVDVPLHDLSAPQSSSAVGQYFTPQLVQTYQPDSSEITYQSANLPYPSLAGYYESAYKVTCCPALPVKLKHTEFQPSSSSLEQSQKAESRPSRFTPADSHDRSDLDPLQLLACAAQQAQSSPSHIVPLNLESKLVESSPHPRTPSIATPARQLQGSKVDQTPLNSGLALLQGYASTSSSSSSSSLSPAPTEIAVTPRLLPPDLAEPSILPITFERLDNHLPVQSHVPVDTTSLKNSESFGTGTKKSPETPSRDLDSNTRSSSLSDLPESFLADPAPRAETRQEEAAPLVLQSSSTTSTETANLPPAVDSTRHTTEVKSRGPSKAPLRPQLGLLRRQSTRIALRSSNEEAASTHREFGIEVELEAITDKIVDTPSDTAQETLSVNKAEYAVPDPHSRNNMSSLPKRQAKKPSRYQSPLESVPPASAPTPPMESAPTPKDEGFSDSSLTPPPMSQPKASTSQAIPSATKDEEHATQVASHKGKGAKASGSTSTKPEAEEQDGSSKKAKAKKEDEPKQKRGRPPSVRLNSTSDRVSSASASVAEGSTSPAKIPKIKLNVGSKSTKQGTAGSSTAPGSEQKRSETPPVTKPGKKAGLSKKRKSESVDPDPVRDTKEPVKKPKIIIKSSKTPSESPAPAAKATSELPKEIANAKESVEEAREQQKKKPIVESQTKPKSKRPVRDYSSDSESDEEYVVKPKRKTQRMIEDDEEDEKADVQPKKKLPKAKEKSMTQPIVKEDKEESELAKRKGAEKSAGSDLAQKGNRALAETHDAKQEQKAEGSSSIPLEKPQDGESANPSSQQTSTLTLKPLPKVNKKKPRPSEVADKIKGPDTPINKSEGLSSLKPKPSAEEGGSLNPNPNPNSNPNKKAVPPRKSLPTGMKPAATSSPAPAPAPAPAPRPSMGLLGNTLALLQGTSTPNAKDKEKDPKLKSEMKDKKETPKVVKRGGWAEEWILTPEQQREYEASAAQRESARKRREEWMRNPVNLQEAKDNYKVDSMQPRTIAVPGAMGIQTAGKPSQMVASLLGW